MHYLKHKISALICLGAGCTTITIVTDVPTLLKKAMTPKQVIETFVKPVSNIKSIQEQIEIQKNNIKEQQQKIDQSFKQKEETEKKIAHYKEETITKQEQSMTFKSQFEQTSEEIIILKTELVKTQAKKTASIQAVTQMSKKLNQNKEETKELNMAIKQLTNKKKALQNLSNTKITTTHTKIDDTTLDANIEIINEMIAENNAIQQMILTPANEELTKLLSKTTNNKNAREEYDKKLEEHLKQIASYNEKATALQNIYTSLLDPSVTVESQTKIMGKSKHIKEQLAKLNDEIKKKTKTLKQTLDEKTSIVSEFKYSKKQLADISKTEYNTWIAIKQQQQDKQQIFAQIQTAQKDLIQNKKEFWQAMKDNAETRKNLNQQMFQKSQKITQITTVQDKLD